MSLDEENFYKFFVLNQIGFTTFYALLSYISFQMKVWNFVKENLVKFEQHR